MPSLGADMDAGTIIEWRVRPGDHVQRGDIVAIVDTDKSEIDVEVFEDGIIDELVVEPGREVPVGTVLARISSAGAPVRAKASSSQATAASATTPARKRQAPAREPRRRRAAALAGPAAPTAPRPLAGTAARTAFVRASPLARKKADALGIDLAGVLGSGPGGAVVVADVAPVAPVAPPVAHAAAPLPAEASTASTDRRASMRQAIGTLMSRSKREIPHYYLATTIDLAAATAWLSEHNGERPLAERLLPAALLLKATALGARDTPGVNGFWADGGFKPASAVHLGVTVSLRGGGLVAPAIHDADTLTLDALMQALRDLVGRARSGRLRSSEMADPTITVTNLGDQGVEEVFGVIYAPQVALVGFGKIVERPWAAAGMLGVRPVVRTTLAGDHRVTDGHDGARFLATIDRLLQTPEAM